MSSAEIQPKITGILSVNRPTHSTESVRIVVRIGKKQSKLSNHGWNDIVENRYAFTETSGYFDITQSCWFGKGFTVVIPTQLFGTTTIKLNLDPSALLTTGFFIEVFKRNAVGLHKVDSSVRYAAGLEVFLQIKWILSTDIDLITPVIRPYPWINPQPELSSVNRPDDNAGPSLRPPTIVSSTIAGPSNPNPSVLNRKTVIFSETTKTEPASDSD